MKSYNKPKPIISITQDDKLKTLGDSRKISLSTLSVYDISFNSISEIVFPYYKYGELVNIKYRKNLSDGKKSFRQEAGTEKTFFGMDQVPTDCKELIIVEGEWDVLSFYEVGLYAVSVPQGASEHKLECIDNCFEWLESFDSFVIAVDSDDAGKKLELKLIDRLGKGKCKIVDWSRYEIEGKDANDFLMKDESGVLIDAVQLSEYIPLDGVEFFSSKKNSILSEYRKEHNVGLSTGWDNVDEIFKIQTGRVMIITGIPTRGKSFFADNLLINLSKLHDWKHLICSFETSSSTHFRMLSQMVIGKSFDTEKSNCMNESEIQKSMNYLDSRFLRLSENECWSIDDILERAEYCIRRYGIKTLTIDPYNRLRQENYDREDKFIDSILAKLSSFSKKHKILVIFIAHPTKMREGQDKPNMYSISGGASWYNMADYGIIIHRDRLVTGELSTETSVIIQKVKDTSLGNPAGGTVNLMYNFKTLSLVKSVLIKQSIFTKGLGK
ncbi:MAG: bifunctional DNA primase/helicase [Candidatus Hodarchaeales archaeon]